MLTQVVDELQRIIRSIESQLSLKSKLWNHLKLKKIKDCFQNQFGEMFRVFK